MHLIYVVEPELAFWEMRVTRYVARLEQHYDLVKQAAVDTTHPAHRKIGLALEKDERDSPVTGAGKNRAGRNDPCLCGSGKKYEHCCLRKGRPWSRWK